MGWGKVAIGAGLGLFLGRSWWGALMGAWVGYLFDKSQASRDPRRRHGGMDSARQYASMSNDRRSMIFCASAGAMMAKIAKADGHVSSEEIAGIEAAFRRLGFSPVARATAVKAFRNAKGDDHTIYEYASEFANVVDSVEVREYLYELLWDVACADNRVSPAELDMLRRLPAALRIRPDWFDAFAYVRLGRGFNGGGGAAPRNALDEAYALLGASRGDSNDELKRKYRELAKKNHPDALRAQGLPEAMIGKATERMSRINDAWSAIRKERGI